MTDDLRRWRARLKVGDRVGYRWDDRYVYPATLRSTYRALNKPGCRTWDLFVDPDPMSGETEVWTVFVTDDTLEPLSDPEPVGPIYVGPPMAPPRRRKRSSRRVASA